MIKISTSFNLEELLKLDPDENGTQAWSDKLHTQRIEGGEHEFSFKIHGEDLFQKKYSTDKYAYLIYYCLQGINNGFYELINKGEDNKTTLVFDPFHEKYVEVEKKNNNLFFTRNQRFPNIKIDGCDLVQAVEEVVRAVNVYKDIFFEAGKRWYPQDPSFVVYFTFGKEERYTKKMFDKPIEEWQEDYKRKWISVLLNNEEVKEIRNKKVIIDVVNSEKELHALLKKLDDATYHVIISNYYDWLPLETAWKEYKEKHGITDSEVKRVMDQAEKEYAVFEEERRRITELLTKTKGIKGSEYKKVQGKVYCNGVEIESADYETFLVLGDLYAKDKERVYYLSIQIASADPQTFKVLSDQYSKDKSHVFAYGAIIKEADPKTFKVLSMWFAKDARHAYRSKYIIKDADAKTFKYLKHSYSKDKNNVYYDLSKVPDADPRTFVVLNDNYTKDKNHVYWYRDKVEGADPASFKVKGSGFERSRSGQDRFRRYYEGKPWEAVSK